MLKAVTVLSIILSTDVTSENEAKIFLRCFMPWNEAMRKISKYQPLVLKSK